MSNYWSDPFFDGSPTSGELVGTAEGGPACTTYSPEYVRSLLTQLEETLAQPDAWVRMTLEELVGVAETLVRLDVKVGEESPTLLPTIDALIVSHCSPDSVDAKNLSKLLNSYAHLGFLHGRLVEFLKLRQSFADMEPCHISGIMFALGKLKMLSSPHAHSNAALSSSELTTVLHRLCQRSAETADRFSPLEISTVVFALARLNHRSVRLLNVFSDALALHVSEASPQIVSNTVYAMGKLGYKSLSLLGAVCASSPPRLSQFKPQELANLVYAFGQLEYRNDAFLFALADHVPSRLSTFKPQELSITAYAYSQLRLSHPRMFAGIAIQIARRIEECSPQAISNTIYAMSKVGFRHNGLLTALALSLPARLAELTPQHVSNIMYSFGKLNHRDDALLGAICSHVPDRLWEFRPQNIANTVYAAGKLGFFHEPLLQAVAEHLPYRLTECVSQDISNIVYSFGQLGYRNEKFVHAVLQYVRSVLIPKGMQQKDLSYLTSALRKAGLDLVAPGNGGSGSTSSDLSLTASSSLSSLVEELDQAARACNVDILSCLKGSGSGR